MSTMKEIIVPQCVMCRAGIPKPKRGPVGKTCSNTCRVKMYRLKNADPSVSLGRAETPSGDETGFTQHIHQKTCYTRSDGSYTSSSIAVLSDSEVRSDPKFDWEWAQALAQEYCRNPEWIERGIAACHEVGVDPQYFIGRYLLRKPIPMNKEVDEAFRGL